MNFRAGFTLIFISILPWLDSGRALAQNIIIKNRVDFSLAAGYCRPLGSKYVREQPTLLANMNSGVSVEARYLISLPANLHAGVTATQTKFSGWNYLDNQLFNETSAGVLSLGITLAYRTWSPGRTLSNKLNFYGAVTPYFSSINVTTKGKSGINSGSETDPLEVNLVRFFVRLEGGLYCNVSQNVSLLVSANYHRAPADSQVFTDKSFSFLSFQIGACARLAKDRRYKLSY